MNFPLPDLKEIEAVHLERCIKALPTNVSIFQGLPHITPLVFYRQITTLIYISWRAIVRIATTAFKRYCSSLDIILEF